MSNTPTDIQPYSTTTTTVATSFTVTCRALVLFTNATFLVQTFDVNKALINTQIVPITNQQYLEWNNNDEFIINLMATILGFVICDRPNPAQVTSIVSTSCVAL